jgi:hypothetical protein
VSVRLSADVGLLDCNVVWTCIYITTYSEKHTSSIFNLKEGGSMFLRKVGIQPEYYTAQLPTRPPSVFTWQQRPQILYNFTYVSSHDIYIPLFFIKALLHESRLVPGDFVLKGNFHLVLIRLVDQICGICDQMRSRGEDGCLLVCCALQSGRSLQTFQKCLLVPLSGW